MPRRSIYRPSGPSAPAPALAAAAAALWLGAAWAEPGPPAPMQEVAVEEIAVRDAVAREVPVPEGALPDVAVPAVAPSPAPRTAAPMRDEAVAGLLWGLTEQSQRLVRAYAQLGLEVRAAAAAAAAADALRTGDRLLASLAASGQRRVTTARQRELEMRWRALRDAVGTRPSPQIARLMDDVSRQLAALAADAAAGLGPAARATRQRTLLHRMAGTYLLACWGALPPAPAALLAMRAEFGHLLAEGADPAAGELDTATLASQWGLLADGLDGHGAACDAATTARVASTADRLAQLLDPPAPRPFAARRP